jgi:hypothetical protein
MKEEPSRFPLQTILITTHTLKSITRKITTMLVMKKGMTRRRGRMKRKRRILY